MQDGADLGGILAAVDHGVPTGGWMPRGFLAESGPRPQYAALYGAEEHPMADYPPRTRANVEWADATLLFTTGPSRGERVAMEAAVAFGKPVAAVCATWPMDHLPGWAVRFRHDQDYDVACWIIAKGVGTLNVAGPRASRAPRVKDFARRFLGRVLVRLGHARVSGP